MGGIPCAIRYSFNSSHYLREYIVSFKGRAVFFRAASVRRYRLYKSREPSAAEVSILEHFCMQKKATGFPIFNYWMPFC